MFYGYIRVSTEERAKVEANFKELYGRALRKPAENMTINI